MLGVGDDQCKVESFMVMVRVWMDSHLSLQLQWDPVRRSSETHPLGIMNNHNTFHGNPAIKTEF